jgi:hypothetical protein
MLASWRRLSSPSRERAQLPAMPLADFVYQLHNMDTLPQDLVNGLVLFVERREGDAQALYPERKKYPANLPPLSALSPYWKEAIEAITFRTLDITSTDLHDLRTIVSGSRREKVKKITFTPVLPAYSDEDCGRRETISDQRANNESLSRSLKHLFDILKVWEDDGVKGTIALHMRNAYSPMDHQHRKKRRHEYEMDVIRGKRTDIFEKRYVGLYIRLVEPEQLPLLNRISSWSVDRVATRDYAPCTIAQIGSRFQNLDSIAWELVDMDDPVSDDVDSLEDIGTSESVDELDRSGCNMSSRRERRNELAEMLVANPLRSVKKAYIELYHEAPEDQRRENEVLLSAASLPDPLSAALYLLSQSLTKLELKATIDQSLFLPPSEHDLMPTWPALRTYIVTFDIATPSGK